jgi:hypothetical protein
MPPIPQTTPFCILGDPRVLIHPEDVSGADMSVVVTIQPRVPASALRASPPRRALEFLVSFEPA